ncbi:MAG: glycoside hydrolase family 2 protein [Mangrovibacterium sp.]
MASTHKILFVLISLGISCTSSSQNLDSIRNEIRKINIAIPTLAPIPTNVDGVKKPWLSLNGTWKFNAENSDLNLAKDIEVPGEWVMQGFQVDTGKEGTYWKKFSVPSDWKGKRIRIRFDGVSSYGKFMLNGKLIGTHEGSFAMFEFDITDLLVSGDNLLEATVQAETISDKLACTSQYAAHTIGGILRKVTLYTLPQSFISDFSWDVKFDKQYHNATLQTNFRLVGFNSSSNAELFFTLTNARGEKVKLEKNSFPIIFKNGLADVSFPVFVKSPLKWDPEHPHLYTLTIKLLAGKRTLQENKQKIGFRQIELRGNQFFVNNHPIKLRGVNRHEVHPLRGRSLTPELCRKDVEMFRTGNCNYIRTSHYPPSEEFLQACDELGMFVESESSLCWIEHGASPIWKEWDYLDTQYLPYMLMANYENVLSGRLHPCVIMWSLGNESRWSPLWEKVNVEVKKLDPSRPTVFHDQCWGGFNNAGSNADVANYHYPGLDGARDCEKDKNRPTLFGEYMHVQCYARRELETDPSVRSDAYSSTLKQMVDSVYRYRAALGGAIWSGIDDIFHLSEDKICGYGPWGCIDGWRRPKPEYTGMKKSYAPVVISNLETAKNENNKLTLNLENRFNHTNLIETEITAQIGDKVVKVKADVPPLAERSVTIDLPKDVRLSDPILITFHDPRGFTCQEELIHPEWQLAEHGAGTNAGLGLKENSHSWIINNDTYRIIIDKNSGTMAAFLENGEKIFENGGQFMIVPFNNDDGGAPHVAGNNYTQDIKPLDYVPDEDFKAASVNVEKLPDESIRVMVKGGVAGKFSGQIFCQFKTDRSITFSYDFETLTDYTRKNLIRQFGMLFRLPLLFDQLEWQRKGLWTVYPEYDINRLTGSTKANPRTLKHVEAPREIPSGEWKNNANLQGTNDFRSTKDRILRAALVNERNLGVEILSDGTQSVRAWVEGNQIYFLVAGLNGPGSCGFFTGPRPQFRIRERLKGRFKLYLR